LWKNDGTGRYSNIATFPSDFSSYSYDAGDYLRYWLERRVTDPLFTPSDSATVNFLTFGGAVSDVGPSDTAFPHRNALLEVQFLGYLQNPTTQSIRGNQA
jgi:hypothetical protein